jgi:O-antigen/teichoic acid export membrane protein
MVAPGFRARGAGADDTEAAAMDEVVLSSADVRKRAAAGALLISMRSLAIRGLGFLGNLVLARLLLPEDFGILAFGLTLISLGTFFADAGIAAGLVRRNRAPALHELRSILGFQLLAASIVATAVAAFAVPAGRSGQVATVMMLSVVVSAWRSPATLLLERQLDYRALATVEVAEGFVFVTVSICAVGLGAGVWGVAGAHVVRAGVGSVLMIRRSPMRVLHPALQMRVIRELFGYGLVVQAGWLFHILRLQVINFTTAAIAGLPVLGYYSLSDRVMQLPWLVFESLIRVTFPAMARIVATGDDARADVERGLRLLTVTAGSLLALVGGTAPSLLPSFFGARWAPAADAVPLIALGMLLAGPVIAVGHGYLYAIGDARKVLVASAAHTATWVVVAVPLLPEIGVTAVGAGLCAGFAVEGLIVARGIRQRTGLRPYRVTAAPSSVMVVAGSIGYAAATAVEPSLVATAVLALGIGVLVAVGVLIVARPTLVEAWGLVRRMAPGSRPPSDGFPGAD